jgi:hypothetical protein
LQRAWSVVRKYALVHDRHLPSPWTSHSVPVEAAPVPPTQRQSFLRHFGALGKRAVVDVRDDTLHVSVYEVVFCRFVAGTPAAYMLLPRKA